MTMMEITAAGTAAVKRLMDAGEIALSPLSFLLYKTTRFGVQHITKHQARKVAPTAARWLILDGQAIEKPLELVVPMTLGPRWNTHALVALAGPLQVERSLRINVATAGKSAGPWAVVVHELPAYRAVANIGSLRPAGEEPWQEVKLGPGTYRLALRYYHWHDGSELPAVEVDDAPAVPALAVPADVNDFYHSLSKRSNFFYLCMHSYVSTLLRYRHWVPASFVKREYLPAGNSQTEFHYGFLPARTSLAVELDPGLLETHDVFFTAYNRASFHLLWYPIRESNHTSRPIMVNCTYLIRVQAKTPAQEAGGRDRIRVRVLPASSSSEVPP